LQVRVNFACCYRMPNDCNPETYTRLQKYVLNYSARSGNSRNLLVALNLMSKASAWIYTTQECHGSLAISIPQRLGLLIFYLWRENIWQQLPSNISNLYCFNTVLHQGTLKGSETTNPRCCFHCPIMLHPLLGRESISLFNDAFSLLLTDSKKKKIPALLHHQNRVHSLSFPSLQHQRQILQQLYKRKLNRTTQFSHRALAQ